MAKGMIERALDAIRKDDADLEERDIRIVLLAALDPRDVFLTDACAEALAKANNPENTLAGMSIFDQEELRSMAGFVIEELNRLAQGERS